MGREDLDGNGSIEARVAGTVHLAHAARSERRLDFVWAKFSPCSDGHQCAQLYANHFARIDEA
jgi:hypothetical protein